MDRSHDGVVGGLLAFVGGVSLVGAGYAALARPRFLPEATPVLFGVAGLFLLVMGVTTYRSPEL